MASSLFGLFKQKPATQPAGPSKGSFVQQKERAGLLVTDELHKALEECKARVARIARECRAKNRKFRDIEFDLENDRQRCLHGLSTADDREIYTPSDVQRVTQIFENPQFFVGGADSNDIVQGGIGDCWFVSALATMATDSGLIERFCVARDEEVGVYGFIFFRDTAWVVVIIDDMLYTSIPKFEELSSAEKQLYHNDKEKYNSSARKGGKSLYFAKSGTQGETWVPLIEKAYAKLHGDYASLSGGEASEAIEDLTGGVSTPLASKDILNVDKFWKEELFKANTDRLFGCAFNTLDSTRNGNPNTEVNGLIGSHAYSVLRAVECRGKRFVVIRNPWGESEWTGPWSDGSKQWTPEWLSILPDLGHVFGNDGQFVMEYRDFLASWDRIDRTLLFDSSWVMSSQWLQVTARSLPSAWAYGDVSFTISLPAPSFTIIVLSKLDERYFRDISGRFMWTFDFVLFKKGEKELLAESSHSRFWARSVNMELELEAGDYVVHVRLDRIPYREENFLVTQAEDKRKLSRVLTERAKSQSIASNFRAETQAVNLPIPLESLAGQDLTELENKALETAEAERKRTFSLIMEPTTINTTETTATIITNEPSLAPDQDETSPKPVTTKGLGSVVGSDDGGEEDQEVGGDSHSEAPQVVGDETFEGPTWDPGFGSVPPSKPFVSDSDCVYMGLRVYTDETAPAVVGGQLRRDGSAF